jgi:hypothetical protein
MDGKAHRKFKIKRDNTGSEVCFWMRTSMLKKTGNIIDGRMEKDSVKNRTMT